MHQNKDVMKNPPRKRKKKTVSGNETFNENTGYGRGNYKKVVKKGDKTVEKTEHYKIKPYDLKNRMSSVDSFTKKKKVTKGNTTKQKTTRWGSASDFVPDRFKKYVKNFSVDSKTKTNSNGKYKGRTRVYSASGDKAVIRTKKK